MRFDVSPLVQVLRRLRELVRRLGGRRRHWAAVLDALSPQMFVGLLDARGRILEGNDSALAAIATRREQLLGLPMWDSPFFRHSAASRARVEAAIRRAAGGETVRGDVEIVLADGSLRIMDMTVQPRRDHRGRVRWLVPSAFDVTDSRRASEALDEHLRVYRFHLSNTPLAVIEWDAALRVRDWPERAEALFGWSREQALGRSARELGLVPEDSAPWPAAADAAAGPQPVRIDACRHRDGRAIVTETYRSVQREADGRLHAVVSFSQDVTAREAALAALRDSEARLGGVFRHAAVGIAVLDSDGRWLQVNQQLCQITGYDEAELLRIDFQTITHPDDLDKDLDQARRVIAGEISGYQMEKRYRRKDGRVVWVLLHVGRIEAADGDASKFVSVVEDISERKDTEERLRALSSSLERQVGDRTQQLRTAVAATEQRNVELIQVAETTGLLAGARDLDEALRIVGRSCRTLFPLAEAALYLGNDLQERLLLQDHWGGGRTPEPTLHADHCWGLRRGKEHRVEDATDPLRCSHHGEACDGRAHSCLPLMALGDRLGLLSLSWRAGAGWAPDPVLLRSLGEQIGLAIGNVRLREELRRQAQHDPLTGLYNRRQLDEHLRQRGAEHARTGRGYSLLLLDLDYFKSINDRFGHEAGDRVLQEAAALFRRCARVEEQVFRLGGEEFVMVLATDDAGEAARAAERVRAEMQNLRVSRRGQILPAVTVSIGIACFPQDGDAPQALLHAADEALYAAKRDGRNRCQRHDQLREQVLARGVPG